MMAREINLNHICKIEGHASLDLKIEANKVTKCHLKASEGARFFEGLVVGKPLKDIQEIVSRICGICSSAHSVASIQGLEEAIGAKPTSRQKYIREMLMLGERIRSHATHLYFLSLPDYFNAESVLSMGPEHKSKIDDALKIITAGNRIVEEFGGRNMHPFLKIREEVSEIDYEELKGRLDDVKPVIYRAIELFSGINYPKLERNSEYLCLNEKSEYAVISGKVISLRESFEDDNYKKHLTENVKEYATSKFALMNGKKYMLGSMARINNNHMQLDKETWEVLTKVLKKVNLSLPFRNPYNNLICQAIELLQAVNRSKKLMENPPVKGHVEKVLIKEGVGVSSVEAPRGTLFHEYKIDKKGIVTYCNIITPTCQNLNMMERDIKELVNGLLASGEGKRGIVDKIEKLIRAYDPCFSCSTHFLKVNWDVDVDSPCS